MKKNNVLAVLITSLIFLSPLLATFMYIKSNWNYIKYYNTSIKSDPELKEIFDSFNNKYFNNTIKIEKIIYEVLDPIAEGKISLRGISCDYTNYKLIVITPSIKNDPELLKSTVLHEMIHCFVTQNYVTAGSAGKKAAMDNYNHRGHFHEIEQKLKLQGAPISEDYLHDVTAAIEQLKKAK